MRQTLNKKIVLLLTCLLLIITCTSCRKNEDYHVIDYLDYLSKESGIGISSEVNENINALYEYKVLNDQFKIEDELLNYEVVKTTLSNLMELDDDCLKDFGWISNDIKDGDLISKEKAIELVDKAVEYINNPVINEKLEYEYSENFTDSPENNNDIFYDYDTNSFKKVETDNDGNIYYSDADIGEVFDLLQIETNYEVDFSKSEIIPYDDNHSGYFKSNYSLLSESHSFNKDGFRISYSVSSSGVSAHISKEDDKVTRYIDLSISNVKPKIKWYMEQGDLKNCFFDVSFNTTEEIGYTSGIYKKYRFDFEDADKSSIKNFFNSIIEKRTNEIENTIKICQIKTPIPNIPTAYLNLDLVANIYVNGEIKLLLQNSHEMGFEVKEGEIRYIGDHTNNWDGIIQASAKATLGINFNLEATSFVLADIELDGGVKANVKTTVHIFDYDGNDETIEIENPYSDIGYISDDSVSIKACGDLSFRWVFDIKINTSRTVLYKYGFSKTYSITDDKDQVFNNLSHIEDGMFVKKCTRVKNKKVKDNSIKIINEKIILKSYAEVIKINESYLIEISLLPEGYSLDDVVIDSLDKSIVFVNGYKAIGVKPGTCKVRVYTKDNKHEAFINILVSTG